MLSRRSGRIIGLVTALLLAMAAAGPVGQGEVGSYAVAAPIRSGDFVAIDEPIKQTLIRLGKQFGVNIVVEAEVQGRVTLTLRGATLDQALMAIVDPMGFRYRVLHGVVIVEAVRPPSSARPVSSPSPSIAPTVLTLSTIHVDRAAIVLRSLFPHDRITVNRDANAVIAIAPPDDIASMRSVLAGIDVQDPTRFTTEAIQLRVVDPRSLVSKLQALYPASRIATGPNHTLIIEAVPVDMNQIKAVVASLDTPLTTARRGNPPFVPPARPWRIRMLAKL